MGYYIEKKTKIVHSHYELHYIDKNECDLFEQIPNDAIKCNKCFDSNGYILKKSGTTPTPPPKS